LSIQHNELIGSLLCNIHNLLTIVTKDHHLKATGSEPKLSS
jgi:hypothetical protein